MLLWADTFNRYGTNTALMLNGLYANNTGMVLAADPDATATGNVAKIALANAARDFRWVYPNGALATVGMMMRVWCSALPLDDNTYTVIYLNDIANVVQVTIRIRSTGQITVYRGDPTGAGVELGTTSVPVISANAWHHLEFKATINGATGAVEVRVNGVSKLTLTGKNTQATANASSAQMSWFNFSGTASNSNIIYIKDFAPWDTTGTYNKDFLGAVQASDIDTVSDTSLTWTPSTGGVGWSILDNNPPVDTTYIGAATALSNIFGLGDLPADATSVKALVLVNRSWKIDGGDGNTQMGIVSGASTGLGSNRPITTAPTYWTDVIEVDPATAIPFTPTGFNAAALKQSRTV